MKYSDIAGVAVLLVMVISTVAAWKLSWIAGAVMLCVWLIVYAFSACSLAKKNGEYHD